MDKIVEYAYAKLNLSLRVLGKEKKYHNLEMFNIPINYYDTLEFEESECDEVLSNYEFDYSSIEYARDAFRKKYSVDKKVKIKINKIIPLGGGLGGGSADSSAVLRGLNRLFDFNYDLSELDDLAKNLGSDNLFCLYNKPAYVTGRGDKIIFIPKPDYIHKVVLIFPKISSKTEEVFSFYKSKYKKTSKLLKYYLSSQYTQYYKNCKNDLTKSACTIYPPLKKISKIKGARMSGSGSTFYIINPKNKDINKLKKLSLNYKLIDY
jgi:4-diphosphocytidyl-2-C-methyl-D-erythritol kinase